MSHFLNEVSLKGWFLLRLHFLTLSFVSDPFLLPLSMIPNSLILELGRIFLGLVESSVSPGFVRLTKNFYTRSEAPPRLGFWYSATGLFSIFRYVKGFGDESVPFHTSSLLDCPLAKMKLLFCSPLLSLLLLLSIRSQQWSSQLWSWKSLSRWTYRSMEVNVPLCRWFDHLLWNSVTSSTPCFAN